MHPHLTGSWWVFGSGIANNKTEYGMTDIHSCSYYCERPECVRAQRDELRDRQWVSLTDEEITSLVREAARGSAINRDGSTSHRIARAIEAKLKEKNA